MLIEKHNQVPEKGRCKQSPTVSLPHFWARETSFVFNEEHNIMYSYYNE